MNDNLQEKLELEVNNINAKNICNITSKDEPEQQILNPTKWWCINQQIYPNSSRTAYGLFAIMSSKCEHVLSKASNKIAAQKSNLSPDIVEGGEEF